MTFILSTVGKTTALSWEGTNKINVCVTIVGQLLPQACAPAALLDSIVNKPCAIK